MVFPSGTVYPRQRNKKMKVLEEYKFRADFEEIFVKDFCCDRFCKKFPRFKNLIGEMKNRIDINYKYFLVDLIIKNHKKGDKTCRDVRYHLDGDYKSDNQYCLWVNGENRTIFSKENIDFDNFPEERSDQNQFLENTLRGKECFEVPENTFVVYSSKDPHKGTICKKSGRRVFVRLMGTNYIPPRNFIKK